jgi:hypothetical protein
MNDQLENAFKAARQMQVSGLAGREELRTVTDFYMTAQASGELPIVALSIQQPWAWLMTAAPVLLQKRIENRTWKKKTPARILVHAGQKADADCHNALVHGRHPVTNESLHPALYDAYLDACVLISPGVSRPPSMGGFVGAMDFTGEVLTESGDPWFMGPYGYVTANARALPFLPWRGMLGFFDAKVAA